MPLLSNSPEQQLQLGQVALPYKYRRHTIQMIIMILGVQTKYTSANAWKRVQYRSVLDQWSLPGGSIFPISEQTSVVTSYHKLR
jgi:hypothetical protein